MEQQKDSFTKYETIIKAEDMLECETHFGKEFFWNELETIVEDGVKISNEES